MLGGRYTFGNSVFSRHCHRTQFLWGQFCKQLTLSSWMVTKGQKSHKRICSQKPQISLRMFNLSLPLSMKGLKTKANWYISSKYLCISCNDRDIFFHATMILTHLLKLTKLLVDKIITKHTALKIIQFRLLGKCAVLRIFSNAVQLY